MPTSLQGMGVLVTRPREQAEALCRLIEQRHGQPHRLPVLEIVGPTDSKALAAVLGSLSQFDMAIFISANAVHHTMNWLQKNQRGLPRQLQIAAVGARSAQCLQEYAIEAHIVPAGPFNSEALLAMPALASVQNKKIVIFRGAGGRELLADTLRRRGAAVRYAEVYTRLRPKADTRAIENIWAQGKIQAVIVSSNESLQNLHAMLGAAVSATLLVTPLVVISQRARELAHTLGVKTVIVAKQASDQEIVAALLEYSGRLSEQTNQGERKPF